MNTERMKKLLMDFCSVPSISETTGEVEMPGMIFSKISEIQYFKDNPGNVAITPIKNDPYKRSFVHALMEGRKKSPKTVILLSHFDVVDIVDYGVYKDYAFKPAEFTELLRKDPNISLTAEARNDLLSGDYLFGRGTMDMKFGLAANVEILYQIERKLDYFPGNVLLLSVPDEENSSAGMLAAVELLCALKEEKGLEYTCCIVSEPYFPKYPGDVSKYIYTGAIGKLLPGFYCVGKETHAGDPFSGLNPNLLTAKLIEEIEQNPDLSDVAEGFRVPAPVCLKQSDIKESYSVSTPAAAYAYFNFMTVTSSPDNVLCKLKSIGEKVFMEVLDGIREKADRLQGLTGSKPMLPEIKPMVITYKELYEMCRETGKEDFERHMETFIKESPQADFRDLCVRIVRETHRFCPYRDPMIVLFLAPPYNPHSGAKRDNRKVMEIAEGIVKKSMDRFGETILIEPFFPGISDMSYLGLPDINTENLKANMPLWGGRYTIPLEAMGNLNIPFINIGPMGKDAHKFTERLCLSYSFNTASRLIFEAALLALDINPESFGL